MLSRLPRWVEYGAFSLSTLAGSVNAVGLLGFQHQSVSHLSGIATLLGAGLSQSLAGSLHLSAFLGAFLFGAALSGFLIEDEVLKLGKRYRLALIIEGGLLLAAMLVLRHESVWGHYLASAACGLQNAMVTTYSGAVVRTTHVTGIFTDLGLMLGARLRGKPFDRRKAQLFLLIIAGFVFGGAMGAMLFQRFGFGALMPPAFLAFGLAALYWYYTRASSVGE